MKLLALNTIGYTGVEILAADLAQFPQIAFLPGQNFIQSGHRFYRPHDYTGFSPEEVFESLSLHQYTKSGRIWAGLTKHMSAEETKNYPVEEHKSIFRKSLGSERDFHSCVSAYLRSYFLATHIPLEDRIYQGFWGHNWLLSDSFLPEHASDLSIINWEAPVYLWLSMSSQHMTWNCLSACKFWLVNCLILKRYAANHAEYLSVRLDNYLADRRSVLEQISDFLGLDRDLNLGKQVLETTSPSGFIQFNQSIMDSIMLGASKLQEIYADHVYFKMAESIDVWQEEFLSDPAHLKLLDDYQSFWNSTAHTNLDWVGPIGEDIVKAAVQTSALSSDRNIAFTFYHEYASIDSDNHSNPSVNLHHYLGCLENGISVPLMPYFLKVVIEYLKNIARNYALHGHSYVSMREGRLYKILNSPVSRPKLEQLGMVNELKTIDELIERAELACGIQSPRLIAQDATTP